MIVIPKLCSNEQLLSVRSGLFYCYSDTILISICLCRVYVGISGFDGTFNRIYPNITVGSLPHPESYAWDSNPIAELVNIALVSHTATSL